MAPHIAIVADDLTGAADTGVAFAAQGKSVLVGWPDRDGRGGWLVLDADVLAVDTRSRAAGPDRARRVTSEAVSLFRDRNVAMLYKKVDSTLRGHVGVEVRAALEQWHPGSVAIVAPAFPAAGRTTVNGHQCVDRKPIGGCGSVPAILESAGTRTRQVSLACVRAATLDETLAAFRPAGTAIVCDAECGADLAAIVRAGNRLGLPIVWVGSGGLARAIAAQQPPTVRSVLTPRATLRGPLLIVVGSTTEQARLQAEHLVAAGVRHVAVPVASISAGGSVGADIGRDLSKHVDAGEDVLVTVSPDSELGERPAEDPALMVRLGEWLRSCAGRFEGLVLTGGDTALGVLQAWGVTGIRLIEEMSAGVVLADAIGPAAMAVVTKSGSFGDRATLTLVRERLHGRG